MSILKQSLILVPALVLLSACGGGDCAPADGRPLATTDTTTTCAVTRGASSITIAYPTLDAIEQLTGGAAAIYSKKGSAIVTDQNGNAVPDDTVVQLDVLDSLIASGFINAGDSIAGSLITDLNPFQGDGLTAAILNTVSVSRGLDPVRTIKAGDLVILRNAASSDSIRYVVSTTANSITVNSPYINSYPSAIYPNAEYLVGQALVGASILGFDDDTGKKTAGVSLTKEGYANFRLEYPGDLLNYGASISDPRALPFGSTEVWVVANVGGSVATAEATAFAGIAPAEIIVSPVTISASGNVTVRLQDAQENALPFTLITAGSDNAATTATSCTTDEFGVCTSAVVRGAAATVTYSSGEATADLTVN
ncbi:MAG: hypothetical protein KAJ39_08100 [Gammaproteobacteria bacterium]|nr:hypothetical protein [Gammaproteobacteria bacterium]